MKRIGITQFKTKCGAVLKSVRKTRKPVLITRFGRPIAQVIAVPRPNRKRPLGTFKGSFEIVGDITSPVVNAQDWDAVRATESGRSVRDFNALMKRLGHVRPGRRFTRDEMNERRA